MGPLPGGPEGLILWPMLRSAALALLLISPAFAGPDEDAAIVEKKKAAAEKAAAAAEADLKADIKKKKEPAEKPFDPDAPLKKIKKEALPAKKEPPAAQAQEEREERTEAASPRRARTASSRSAAHPGQRAPDASAREAAPDAPAPERRVDRALRKVKSAGRAWEKSTEDAATAPPEPSAPARRSGASDPASPASDRDLALAAGTGLRGAFTDLGLKPGPSGGPAVVHEDGAPATAQEVERLKEAIAAQPRALLRRPDFFQVVPRRDFDRVKQAAAAPAGEPALRHIGLSEDRRDVVRSLSCSPLSGGCNPYAAVSSYKRGDFVPPEEIFRISRALPPRPGSASADAAAPEKESSIYEELTEDDEAAYREWVQAAGQQEPKRSVFKDISGLLASIGGAFGGQPAVPRGENAAAAAADVLRLPLPDGALAAAGSGASASAAARRGTRGSSAPAADAAAGSEAPPPRRAGPWLWALAAGAAALLLYGAKRS